MAKHSERVLLTGATGFVGRHLWEPLQRPGREVLCASRRPDEARAVHPDRVWVRFDAEDPNTFPQAVAGCDAVIYLVHGMSTAGDYERRERGAAVNMVHAAERAGIRRLVYLGGMPPQGEPSRHLRSRLVVGEILRTGRFATIELQASMIIGTGSESWTIVRDLSARLPVMILPRWLGSRSQPIAIDDVTAAIVHALTLPEEVAGAYPLPGPETLSAREILARIAHLRGTRPAMLSVPFVTPRLSSYWIQWVTRANHLVARELVEGLRHDLVARDDGFWKLMPGHRRIAFDEAASRALAEDQEGLALSARLMEAAVKQVASRRESRRD